MVDSLHVQDMYDLRVDSLNFMRYSMASHCSRLRRISDGEKRGFCARLFGTLLHLDRY